MSYLIILTLSFAVDLESSQISGGPRKSGGEGDGEVDNIASIEKSDRAVKASSCSHFRCPDERGGMCLREGASGCGAGEKCCNGLQCHSKTGICLGKGGMK